MGFVNRDSGRWPNGEVPYVTEYGFSTTHTGRQALQGAISAYANETAITIRPERNGDQVVVLVSDYKGILGDCFSLSNGRNYHFQVIHCIYHSTEYLMHEFGHVIGLHHEQTRPDRDQFIKLNFWYSSLDQNWAIQDEKNDLTITPYDCQSLMHYPPHPMPTNPPQYNYTTLTTCPSPKGSWGSQGAVFTPGDLAAISFLYPMKRLKFIYDEVDRNMVAAEFSLISPDFLSFRNYCFWYKSNNGMIQIRELNPGSRPKFLMQNTWPRNISNVFSFSIPAYIPEQKAKNFPPVGGRGTLPRLPNSPPDPIGGSSLPESLSSTLPGFITIPVPIIARYQRDTGYLELFEAFTQNTGQIDLTQKAKHKIGHDWTHFVPFSINNNVMIYIYSSISRQEHILYVLSQPNQKIQIIGYGSPHTAILSTTYPSQLTDWSDFVITMGLDSWGLPVPYLLQYSESTGEGSVSIMRFKLNGFELVPLSHEPQRDITGETSLGGFHLYFFRHVHKGAGRFLTTRFGYGNLIFKSYLFQNKNYLFTFNGWTGVLQIWRADIDPIPGYYTWRLIGETIWGTDWDSFIPYSARDTQGRMCLWYQLYSSKTGDMEVGRVYAT